VLAGLSRACVRRRWFVIAAWAVVLVLGLTVGSDIFSRVTSSGSASDDMESIRANNLVYEVSPAGDRVLVLVDGVDTDTARLVREATARAASLPDVYAVVSPLDPEPSSGAADPGAPTGVPVSAEAWDALRGTLRSIDGRALLVTVDLRAGLAAVDQRRTTEQVRDAFADLDSAPGTSVRLGGLVNVNHDLYQQVERDTRRGELIAVPLTLLVLTVIFRGIAPALIPIAGAVASVAGAMLVLLGLSRSLPVDALAVPVTTVLGLALATDYSLLQVSRFREERASAPDLVTAISRTSSTAGRTVVFSGVTVGCSLSGLFFMQSNTYRVAATAAVSVTLLSVAAATTLTPALLSLVAPHMRVPTLVPSDDGPFARLARRVQRHPGAVAAVICTVLLAMAAPLLRVSFENALVELLPPDAESRVVSDTLTERFPGRSAEPVVVVARTDLDSLRSWVRTFAEKPEVLFVAEPVAVGPGVAQVSIVPEGVSQGEPARALVRDLRERRPDFPALVGGVAAVQVDLEHELRTRGPLALAWIAATTLVMLFLMTGSAVLPVKALVMNIVTIGAALGVVVLVFQEGLGSRLLDVEATGALETTLPMLVLAFTFGLSMDFELFLLSRVLEKHHQGEPDDRAVQIGLQRSGPIITNAALLMIVVFLAFVGGRMIQVKEVGLALAITVALDATVIRLVLVPATMALLGDWNWWAPAPLRRLHRRLGLSETAPPPAGAGAPDPAAIELVE
jgi:putative drug exporter of the RND superfamily